MAGLSQAAPAGPLFLPLRAEFYQAFAAGEKDTEFRLYGPRWNERVCWVGRGVILSCGYGKYRRCSGRIGGWFLTTVGSAPEGVRRCYPKAALAAPVFAFVITRIEAC